MKGSLPDRILEVFERSVTTEFVTVDRGAHPVVWPLAPRYHAEEGCIDVTVVRGDIDQAGHSVADAHVALLFSEAAPMVLVQGTAQVEDRDSADVDVHVRPERIYVWSSADLEDEPELYDATSTRSVPRTTRSPRSRIRRPRAGRRRGTGAWTSSEPATRRRCWPSWAPRAFPSPSACRCGRTVRPAWSASRPTRSGRPSSPASPVSAPMRPSTASTCSATLRSTAGGWVLRPHRVVGASHTH